MGRLVFAALALLTLAAGCGSDETAVGDGLTGRTFLSDRVTGHELVPGTHLRLQFRDDGTVNVNTGCNHLFGELTIDDEVLEVSSMGGTEMGCDPPRHQQDEWIADFLGAGPTWELAGDTLTLSSGDTVVVLTDRDVADPDRPLLDTEWVLDGIVDDDTVSSVPGEVRATLHVADERIGFRVCNEGSGDLTLGEGELTIGTMEQTHMACDPTTMEVEAAVIAALQGRIAFDIEAATLRLTHPDGHGLVLRADG